MALRLSTLLQGLGLALLSACAPQAEQPPENTPTASASVRDVFGTPPPAPRWYSPAQVSMGESVYIRHCQVCHRLRGQGAPNWRRQRPEGYPPPPLDGSAHAWHHPLADLLKAVNAGFQTDTGSVRMPAFAKTLSEAEKRAVIAYIQSLWLPATYDLWYARVSGAKPSFEAERRP